MGSFFNIQLSRLAAIAALAYACLAPASAQEPTAQAVALARDLITAKGAAAMYDPMILQAHCAD